MLQPCRHHVSTLVRSIIVRKFSAETTKTSLASGTATRQASEQTNPINDRDVFGTLSDSGRRSLQVQLVDKTIPDDSDGYDKMEYDIIPRKNAYYYKYEIPKYARQGPTGLRKALELFKDMKSKDRLEPSSDIFSTLIYGCARSGYTKRAFDLYEESLRYRQKPTKSVVTCLINSCAESPFPDYGLERLNWFMTHMKVEYNWKFNEIQYNSAIKAYGKLGKLEEASKLVQEMLNNEVMPSVDTFNMLLIGCASNKEAGCAIALRVFKRLKMYGFSPAVVTYRLFLRCIRDCGMGSAKLVEKILEELPSLTNIDQRLKYNKKSKNIVKKRKFTSGFEWAPLTSDIGRSIKTAITSPDNDCDKSVVASAQRGCNNEVKTYDKSEAGVAIRTDSGDKLVPANNIREELLPNLLSDDHLNLMYRIKSIEFDKLEHRNQRLALFGGTRGFLDKMMQDNCKPDARTFSILLPCLAAKREDYLEYHRLALDLGIERDLSYYDQLIRDICDHNRVSNRLELALHFIEQMHLDDLRPNISTFEALAGGCSSWRKARCLLDDVEKCGFVISPVIVAKFLTRATKDVNFLFLVNLIDYCIEIKFKPRMHHVEELENLRLKINGLIMEQEKNDPNQQSVKLDSRQINIKHFDLFQIKLDRWLKHAVLYQEDHPWKQFKVDTSSKRDGFTQFKKHFKVLEELKEESLKRGGSLGNLSYKAQRLAGAQA